MPSDVQPSTRRPTAMTVAAVLIAALVPVGLLRQTLRPVDDPDAFWHILSGQNVWRTHDVVVEDPFGRFSTNTWVQLDWLSDLGMAGAYHAGGLPAVAWLYTALGVALYVALYAACRVSAAPVIAALVAVFGWIGTYASQGFRPQTVSFILLAITALVWERVRRGSGRDPWWLVAVSFVWACSHGLWFVGPLVGFAVVAGMVMDRTRPRAELLRLAAIPLASVVVAAFTPIGPLLLAAPLTVNSYAGLVSEWASPDLHEPYVVAAVGLLLVTVVGWARSQVRAPSPHLLLWIIALVWTLLYTRTVAVGAVIAAPLAAHALSGLFPIPEDPAARRLERWLVPAGAAAAVLIAGLLAPVTAAGTSGMPEALGARIAALPADTVVLNDDAVGGWLLLNHPEVHPVIDTRTYLFSVPYIEDYIAARAAQGDWQAFVRDTGSTAALLPEESPLATALEETRGWVATGRGDGFVLLTAPGTTP